MSSAWLTFAAFKAVDVVPTCSAGAPGPRAEAAPERSSGGAPRRPQLRVPDLDAGAQLDSASPAGDTIPAGHAAAANGNGAQRHWLSDHRNPVYGQVRCACSIPTIFCPGCSSLEQACCTCFSPTSTCLGAPLWSRRGANMLALHALHAGTHMQRHDAARV